MADNLLCPEDYALRLETTPESTGRPHCHAMCAPPRPAPPTAMALAFAAASSRGRARRGRERVRACMGGCAEFMRRRPGDSGRQRDGGGGSTIARAGEQVFLTDCARGAVSLRVQHHVCDAQRRPHARQCPAHDAEPKPKGSSGAGSRDSCAQPLGALSPLFRDRHPPAHTTTVGYGLQRPTSVFLSCAEVCSICRPHSLRDTCTTQVTFCGYSVPHPLENKMHLHIQVCPASSLTMWTKDVAVAHACACRCFLRARMRARAFL